MEFAFLVLDLIYVSVPAKILSDGKAEVLAESTVFSVWLYVWCIEQAGEDF